MNAPEIPTHFMAVCDVCRSIQTFTSERARDLWEAHHPHENGDYADE